MREDTIKAQKYLDKIEHQEAENKKNEENEEEEKEETEQLEEKNDDDEEEEDNNEGIEKVLNNVQLIEVNVNTATGRNTNLSVLKKYDFIDFNELTCNLCLMKLDINCVMHKNSNNFLCSTCTAAAASVHQSTPATIHYPIQNHNGGPIIKDLTKHYTMMQDKIEEAMNNTQGGTMKNDEGGNITSTTIEAMNNTEGGTMKNNEWGNITSTTIEAMNNTEGGTMKIDEGGNITSTTIDKSG
jgi:hypothetical protein